VGILAQDTIGTVPIVLSVVPIFAFLCRLGNGTYRRKLYGADPILQKLVNILSTVGTVLKPVGRVPVPT